MKLMRDFLVCLVCGVAMAYLFFVVGLDLHYQSTERPPWGKPSTVEQQTAGFLDTTRGR